jgi:hypothetical protein
MRSRLYNSTVEDLSGKSMRVIEPVLVACLVPKAGPMALPLQTGLDTWAAVGTGPLDMPGSANRQVQNRKTVRKTLLSTGDCAGRPRTVSPDVC